MGNATGTDNHLGTVGSQEAALLLTHFIGHDKDTMIAFDRRGDSQPMTRITTGWLNYGAAWTQ